MRTGAARPGAAVPNLLTVALSAAATYRWLWDCFEAGLLAQYRQSTVPMRELRSFIERLRDELGVPYPLAHARPFVGTGRRLLMAAQEAAELGADWSLVAVANRQLGLTPASDAFYRRVVWSGDEAGAWRPHDDPNSPVIVDPDLRAGQPAVGGIRTEVVWEHLHADRHVIPQGVRHGIPHLGLVVERYPLVMGACPAASLLVLTAAALWSAGWVDGQVASSADSSCRP